MTGTVTMLHPDRLTLRDDGFFCPHCGGDAGPGTGAGVYACGRCGAMMACKVHRVRRFQSRPLTPPELERLARLEDDHSAEAVARLTPLELDFAIAQAPAVDVPRPTARRWPAGAAMLIGAIASVAVWAMFAWWLT